MKVGDRVRLTKDRFTLCEENPKWPEYDVLGVIAYIGNSNMEMNIRVDWDNGHNNIYDNFDLRIIEDKPIIDVDELFKEIEI